MAAASTNSNLPFPHIAWTKPATEKKRCTNVEFRLLFKGGPTAFTNEPDEKCHKKLLAYSKRSARCSPEQLAVELYAARHFAMFATLIASTTLSANAWCYRDRVEDDDRYDPGGKFLTQLLHSNAAGSIGHCRAAAALVGTLSRDDFQRNLLDISAICSVCGPQPMFSVFTRRLGLDLEEAPLPSSALLDIYAPVPMRYWWNRLMDHADRYKQSAVERAVLILYAKGLPLTVVHLVTDCMYLMPAVVNREPAINPPPAPPVPNSTRVWGDALRRMQSATIETVSSNLMRLFL